MKRENIFKLLKQNYDFNNEIIKIDKFLNQEYLFCKRKNDSRTGESRLKNYTFKDFIDSFLFDDYKYKDTCLTVDEFYKHCNASWDYFNRNKISEEVIVNYLETTENLFKLYLDKSETLYDNHGVKYYGETYDKII